MAGVARSCASPNGALYGSPGQRPGYTVDTDASPVGATSRRDGAIGSPLQGSFPGEPDPRALPWATLVRAVGAFDDTTESFGGDAIAPPI